MINNDRMISLDWPFSIVRVLFIGFSQARLHFRGALVQITLLQRLSNQRLGLEDNGGLIEMKFKSSFCVF